MLVKDELDKIVKSKSISYYQLSKILDYDESYINNILKGKRPFPDHLIDKICEVLEINKDEFLAWIIVDKYSKEVIQIAVNELNNREDISKLVLTQKIDQKLKEKGLSRTALSKMINYSQSGLNRMIVGKESLSKSVISRIAPILEVSEDSIKGWVLADKYPTEVLTLALDQS